MLGIFAVAGCENRQQNGQEQTTQQITQNMETVSQESTAMQQESVNAFEAETEVTSAEVMSTEVTKVETQEEVQATQSISKEPTQEVVQQGENDMVIDITINGTTLQAELIDNSSSRALIEHLSGGDVTLYMEDYSNFEKVGSLGFSLPRNDSYYTTHSGDIILYQGNQLTFYYDTNSWNFTKLGEFRNVSDAQLRSILGTGDVTATLSLR